jgi:thiamine kinase-like enzyme
MELMDNYKPLSDFIGTPFFQKYRFMAIYELHRLHQFGYIHNDFHYENVLINTSYSYFNQTSGRAILIDFGYSTRTTNQNAVELLQYEISGIDKNIMDVFNYFYTQRKAYQHTCLTNLEIKLNDKLNRIIHHITIYKGGEMNSDTPQKPHPPKYRENEWSGLDYESFKEIIANDFEKNFHKSNPEGFKKYNDSINSVLEEQKTDPQYFEKLVMAQFNGLIVQRK